MSTAVSTVGVMFRDVELDISTVFVVFLVNLFIFVLPLLFGRKFLQIFALRKNTITAEFESPLGLSPAEIQFFYHRASGKTIAATIVDLTQRSLLHIKNEKDRKQIFVGPKVEDDLKPHEKFVVDLADKKEGITAGELLGDSKSHNLRAFTELVRENLLKNGFLREDRAVAFIKFFLKRLILLLFFLLWVPFLVSITLSILDSGSSDLSTFGSYSSLLLFTTAILLVPFSLVTLALVILTSRIFGRQWSITPKLRRLWVQFSGFKNYVYLVELGVLNYKSKSLKKSIVIEVLPYSVVFGFVKNWEKIIK